MLMDNNYWPTDKTGNIVGTIEEWTVQQVSRKEFIVWGDMHNDTHERWQDGMSFHTSGIKNRSVKEGDIITTRNNTYKLGKPAEVVSE